MLPGAPRHPLQGEQLQPISRFQAAAVGQHIYIHTHRNISNILRLDTAALPPHLELLPVAAPAGGSAEPGPSSRGLHSMTAVGGWREGVAGALCT